LKRGISSFFPILYLLSSFLRLLTSVIGMDFMRFLGFSAERIQASFAQNPLGVQGKRFCGTNAAP